MRKKFFAMYALVGALVASPVFTSCIDDTESASVTAVRTQKAEAMRIANQIAAATVEMQIEANKLKYEAEIANYEQNIARYEALLLEYQYDIKVNQDLLDSYGVKTLSQLTNAYTDALYYAANTEWNIVKYNQQIEALKGDFLGEQEYVVEETARLEAEIAAKEAEIAKYKKLQEGGIDKESMQAEVEELRIASEKAEKEYNELVNKYGNGASKTVTGEVLSTLNSNLYQYDAEGYPVLKEAVVATEKATLATNIETAEKNLADAVAKLGTEDDKKDATYYDATLPTPANVQTLYAALAEAKETFTAAEKAYNEKNDAVEKAEKAVADAQTALDAENAKTTPDATKVTELTTALTTAQTALATAQTALTADIVTAYNTAKTALASAESAVLTAKDGLVSLETAVASKKKASEDFETAIAAFAGEDYEAYKTALTELKEASDAKTLALGEYQALNNIYSNYNEGVIVTEWRWDNSQQTYIAYSEIKLSDYIKQLETEIEGYKAEIAELEAVVEYYENGYVDVDSEEMLAIVVAHIEKKIAIEETKLASYNKMAEEAKAALDAYLAE